jgi:hypothetical protein
MAYEYLSGFCNFLRKYVEKIICSKHPNIPSSSSVSSVVFMHEYIVEERREESLAGYEVGV